MTACISVPLGRFPITERRCLMMLKPCFVDSALRSTIRDGSLILRHRNSRRRCISCLLETVVTAACTNSQLQGDFGRGLMKVIEMEKGTGTLMYVMSRMLLADIDPSTAKVAISVLGPILSAFSFLFIIGIVMS